LDTVKSIDPVAILGHGAAGTAASMHPWIEALASHGLAVLAIDLPRGRAERAVPVFDKAIAASGAVVAGGHSFGGRVASIAVASRLESGDAGVRGLLLLSYPLHRPGKPELWADRTRPSGPRRDHEIVALSGVFNKSVAQQADPETGRYAASEMQLTWQRCCRQEPQPDTIRGTSSISWWESVDGPFGSTPTRPAGHRSIPAFGLR
jgi:pimeloyl-ACP methyl ester carboxylesterase